mmetsp:Transcript_11998/g.29051  ORF Transcript_11998/g.29051 Transcript_11998/m.29051 type:complete len:247 (-) Transcript_11998:604-1344(-)
MARRCFFAVIDSRYSGRPLPRVSVPVVTSKCRPGVPSAAFSSLSRHTCALTFRYCGASFAAPWIFMRGFSELFRSLYLKAALSMVDDVDRTARITSVFVAGVHGSWSVLLVVRSGEFGFALVLLEGRAALGVPFQWCMRMKFSMLHSASLSPKLAAAGPIAVGKFLVVLPFSARAAKWARHARRLARLDILPTQSVTCSSPRFCCMNWSTVSCMALNAVGSSVSTCGSGGRMPGPDFASATACTSS